MYFLPTYLLPVCDQAHPVELGQTDLFKEVETFGLLYELWPPTFQEYLSLGKWDLQVNFSPYNSKETWTGKMAQKQTLTWKKKGGASFV